MLKRFLFPGFNVETVEYKNISFTVWDVGGQDKVHIFKSCLDHSIVSLLYTLCSASEAASACQWFWCDYH